MAILTYYTPIQVGGIYAAYNPIEFNVFVSSQKEVVYCDVYMNGYYYKTLSSTMPIPASATTHYFDIQSVVQEFLTHSLPYPRAAIILQGSSPINTYNGDSCVMAVVQCRFRGSTVSATGVITPETPIPVQRTVDTLPVDGGGTGGPIFFVVNSALQHEENLSLEENLKYYRSIPITAGAYALEQSARIYGMSNAEAYNLYKDDYALYPFIICDNGWGAVIVGPGSPPTSPNPNRICEVRIMAVNNAGVGTAYIPGDNTFRIQLTTNRLYYLPIGHANMKLMPNYNTIPWDTIKYYYVVLWDTLYNRVVLYSPKITLRQTPEMRKRLWYLNRMGMFEAISFSDYTETVTVKSSLKQAVRPMMQGFTTNKHLGGVERNNVRSNEVVSVIGSFEEQEMTAIEQLLTSPKVYVEWEGVTPKAGLVGAQSIAPQLIPVKIKDSDIDKKKIDDRFAYDVAIVYEMSNANNHQRL